VLGYYLLGRRRRRHERSRQRHLARGHHHLGGERPEPAPAGGEKPAEKGGPALAKAGV
jgi:hypothetical protein